MYRKLLDNHVALTDEERDRLRQEYEQKSSKLDIESVSSWSASSELTSHRAHADKLARKRALRLDAVDKEQQQKLTVTLRVNCLSNEDRRNSPVFSYVTCV